MPARPLIAHLALRLGALVDISQRRVVLICVPRPTRAATVACCTRRVRDARRPGRHAGNTAHPCQGRACLPRAL